MLSWKTMVRAVVPGVAGLLMATITPAKAAIDVLVVEAGDDVVASFAGSLDLLGLTLNGIEQGSAAINEDSILFSAADGSSPDHDVYIGIDGPLFPASFAKADHAQGDYLGVINAFDALMLPVGYQSGEVISGLMRFEDMTLLSLGLIQGEYLYDWRADFIRVRVLGADAAVPVPAAAFLMLPALAGAALTRKKRR
ncbi:MAG: hypothetical protein HRU11_04810 [Parvularculaceae bacterium]|nr:hypothetical protein [Parvularculaceae bacterium]